MICKWVADGFLERRLPRVYGVGHSAPSVEADLMEAILYAGPGASLAAGTCLWWRGLLKYPPPLIHVTTPHRRTRQPGIKILARRQVRREPHSGLMTTTVAQALLDFAATAPFDLVQFALSNADYHDVLDVEEINAVLGQGRPGSKRLRAALDAHIPELAETVSELEQALVRLLASAPDIPMPTINRRAREGRVDAYWKAQRLIVEVDGVKGHRSPHQVNRDHTRDLNHRTDGIDTRRYSHHLVTRTPAAVLDDIRRGLGLLAA
jgi:hypothetical protein